MYLTAAFSNVTDTFVPGVRKLEYILSIWQSRSGIFIQGFRWHLCQKKQTDHALNAPMKPKEMCIPLSNI